MVPFTGPMTVTFASARILKMLLDCIFSQLTCTTQLAFLPESCTKKIGAAGETTIRRALHQKNNHFQKKKIIKQQIIPTDQQLVIKLHFHQL